MSRPKINQDLRKYTLLLNAGELQEASSLAVKVEGIPASVAGNISAFLRHCVRQYIIQQLERQ